MRANKGGKSARISEQVLEITFNEQKEEHAKEEMSNERYERHADLTAL